MKHTLDVIHTPTKAEVDALIHSAYSGRFEDMMYDNKHVIPSQR